MNFIQVQPANFHMFFSESPSQRGFAADFQRNFSFSSFGSIFSKKVLGTNF